MAVINALSCSHIPFFFQVASLAALFLEVAETTCSLSIFALSSVWGGRGDGEGRRKEERRRKEKRRGEEKRSKEKRREEEKRGGGEGRAERREGTD